MHQTALLLLHAVRALRGLAVAWPSLLVARLATYMVVLRPFAMAGGSKGTQPIVRQLV
jgi:hypothetical protein